MNPESLADWELWLTEHPAAVDQTVHDPDSIDREFCVHNTNLHLAILRHWISKDWPSESALVSLLLDRGADPNRQNDDGETALHVACSTDTRCRNNVSLLLDHGADPNIPNNRGELPLHHVAYAYGGNSVCREIADSLLDHQSNVDFDTAVCLGDIERASSYVSEGGLEQSRDPKTLLQSAVISQSPGMVELILSHGADPNATKRGENPLYTASRCGNPSIVKLLLEHGADPNPKRYKPLAAARSNNKQTIVAILRAAGAR